MNPNQPGTSNFLQGGQPQNPMQAQNGTMQGGGAPKKFKMPDLNELYGNIQKLRQFASPSLKALLDQIPHPIHPDYQYGNPGMGGY